MRQALSNLIWVAAICPDGRCGHMEYQAAELAGSIAVSCTVVKEVGQDGDAGLYGSFQT